MKNGDYVIGAVLEEQPKGFLVVTIEDGKVSEPYLLYRQSDGMPEAAAHVLSSFNQHGPRWWGFTIGGGGDLKLLKGCEKVHDDQIALVIKGLNKDRDNETRFMDLLQRFPSLAKRG